MNTFSNDKSGWQARLQKNTLWLGVWTFLWVISTACLAFGPKFVWAFNTKLTLLAVIVNIVIGAVMIIVNVRHIKLLDELARKIFLEASALTLGVILVCGSCYGLLQNIQLIHSHPQISHVIILAGLTFMTAVFLGNRRYQ